MMKPSLNILHSLCRRSFRFRIGLSGVIVSLIVWANGTGRLHGAEFVCVDVKDARSLITSAEFVHTELEAFGMEVINALYPFLQTLSVEDSKVQQVITSHTVVFNASERKKAEEILALYDHLSPSDKSSVEMIGLEWFLKVIAAPDTEKLSVLLDSDLTRAYFFLFAEDSFRRLKTYIGFRHFLDENIEIYDREYLEKVEREFHMLGSSFLEGSPFRHRWTPTEQIVSLTAPKKGDCLVELNANIGYFTTRFAPLVGDSGSVIAMNFEQGHSVFIEEFADVHRLKNIRAKTTDQDGLHLEKETADIVFSDQFYRLLYIDMKKARRLTYLNDIVSVLKTGGRLIIVETAMAREDIVGFKLAPEFVIAQLGFYGMELVTRKTLNDELYYLEFVKTPSFTPVPPGSSGDTSIFAAPTVFSIDTPESLLHIGSLDSFDLTEEGIECGRLLYAAIEEDNPEKAKEAVAIYDKIIPLQNIGGEYSALKWYAETVFHLNAESRKHLDDPLCRFYYEYFIRDDFALLKEFLILKYKIKKTDVERSKRKDLGRYPLMNDLILFSNPIREQWENTPLLSSRLLLQKGEHVADIGCGPGLFCDIMAKQVGPEGIVYGLDIKQDHLDLIEQFCEKNGIKNIKTVLSGISTLNLPENSLDAAFMCSLYHVIYAEAEKERLAFLTDLKKCLKPGGRFLVVDNNPVDKDDLPYHGNYIDKRLVVSQLHYYGFKLKRYEQIVAQRYLLEFVLDR